MSDTPRTDEAIGIQYGDRPEWVHVDVARQLERELSAARAVIAAAKAVMARIEKRADLRPDDDPARECAHILSEVRRAK